MTIEMLHSGPSQASTREVSHQRRGRSSQRSARVRPSRSSYLLADLELFAEVKPSELCVAKRLLTELTLGAGQVLTQQGRRGDALLIIVDGLVEVTRHDGHASKALGEVSSGETLGEVSLLHRVACSATATTLTQTTVFVASRREFYSLLKAFPSVETRLRATAAMRLSANMAA
jgi:CRP-like cAMP-binding protein